MYDSFQIFLNISLYHYLILGLIVFCIGLLGVLCSKNIIRILMSIELMFMGCNINFIAFANYLDLGSLLGESFAVFVISVSAIEAAIGIAILICISKLGKDIITDNNRELGGRNV